MAINILVLKADVNGKIVVVRFFFVGYKNGGSSSLNSFGSSSHFLIYCNGAQTDFGQRYKHVYLKHTTHHDSGCIKVIPKHSKQLTQMQTISYSRTFNAK